MTPITRVKRATTRRQSGEWEWLNSIVAAHDAGVSLRVIAKAAGVSHVRVLQIVRMPRHPVCAKCGRPVTGSRHDALCGGFTRVP